ncbi:MAG: sodium:proton antiporter [Lachnospiraceae bacterium]|nr:sodium:proton antiporter [Lachnospiraceae bacterium]
MYFFFLLIWIAFNGQFTWEIFWFGVVIAALMYAFICKYMDYSVHKDIVFFRKSLAFLNYMRILVIEVIKANIASMRFLFSQKTEIEPLLITFRVPLKTEIGRVLLANSITLTPGTITVSVEGDRFTVYCLDKEMAEGLSDGIFVQKLLKLEEVK